MDRRRFAFHPWVRRTCRTAMLWGMGVLTLLAAGAWWLAGGESDTWSRGLGVLAAYALLFWASLFKIWWTAGLPAVEVLEDGFTYQPLYLFRPREIPFDRVLACHPRPDTHSLRLVIAGARHDRELFLNLALIAGRRPFLNLLGQRLAARGFVPMAGMKDAWKRPGWEEPLPGMVT